MKPVLATTVKLAKFVGVAIVLVSLVLVMGEKALSQRHRLEEKGAVLDRENQRLTEEIRSLERKVKLLRTDARMIEKVAKCKLGMARPDETVYMFHDKRRETRGSDE